MDSPEENGVVLEACSIHKSFPNGSDWIRVLRGVDFVLPKGQTVSIQGESGSGKTTFLNVISGLEAFDEGQLLWDGEELKNKSSATVASRRARQIGLIFQAYYLLPELNVFDNVILATRLLRAPRSKDRDRARSLLNRVGLSERMHFSVEKLSGGERQRVAIARALMNKPNLILADEPTGNLDEQTGDSVIGLLLEIAREEGTSLILVTHNSGHAKKTDMRYQLHLGKLEPFKDES